MYRRGKVDGEYQDGEVRGMVFVAGKRGMGKTTEIARLSGSCSGGVIFFDTLASHGSVLRGWEILSEPGELKAYLMQHHRGKFRALYQPMAGDKDAHFAAVARIVLALGNVVFAVDELDALCGTRYGDSRMPPPLYDIVNYGRHSSVAMLATARRPAQVPRGFTGGCYEMRVFRISEKIDLAYFRDMVGDTVELKNRGSQPTIEVLQRLEKFQFLLYRDGEDTHQISGGRRT